VRVATVRLSDDAVAYARARNARDAETLRIFSSDLAAAREPTRIAEHERAVALAEARLGRRLTAAETRIDLVGIDRDLREGKARLAAAIDAEKRRAIGRIFRGTHRVRIEPTPEMLAVLRSLYRAGRAHALDELRAAGVKLADRDLAAADEIPPTAHERLAALLTQLQGRVEARATVAVSDASVGLDLSAVARTAAGRRVLAMPGALDVASRVVSTAMFAGIGDVFSSAVGLFAGFQYSAVNDAATCDVCSEADGTEYASWEEAMVDLPDGGPNPDCDGDGRCRCRVVPLGDAAVDDSGIPLPPPEEAAVEEPVAEETIGLPPPDEIIPGYGRTLDELLPGPSDAFVETRMNEINLYAERQGAKHNMAEAAYIDAVDEHLRHHLADATISVRVRREALHSILDDGRFKSQFETNTSGGALNRDLRARAERNMFGYPVDLPDEHRPIYGYVSGSLAEGGAGENYGEIRVILKPHVRERATFTLQDSLAEGAIPQPIDSPTIYAMDSTYRSQDILPALSGVNGSLARVSDYYAEAQIHGGLAASEIDEVVIPNISTISETARIMIERELAVWRDTLDAGIGTPEGRAEAARRVAELEAALNPVDPYAALEARLDSLGIPWRRADRVDR
jgi:hypothetical protein